MAITTLLRRRPSIATVLTLGFGVLIVAAVAGVLYLGLKSAERNTRDLIRDKAVLIVTGVTERVRMHLDAARDQTAYLAELVAVKAFDPNNRDMLFAYLTASLAAVPQVRGIVYLDQNLNAQYVRRESPQPVPVYSDLGGMPQAAVLLANWQQAQAPFWTPPSYAPAAQGTLLNVQTAARRDGELLGGFVASVRIDDLSDYLSQIDVGDGGTAFILLGADQVIAHPELAGGVAGLSADQPLPVLADSADPVLRALWDPDASEPVPLDYRHPGFYGRYVTVGKERHVAVYQWLRGYGDMPWIIGSHFRTADIGAEFARVQQAAVAGLAVLTLAVLVAFLIARLISAPLERLAAAADQVRRYGPDRATPLPPGRFAELHAASRAFNAMTEGLRERELLRATFGRYVPEGLADAILKDRGVLRPHTQTATVLFTDIAGFSTLAETMPPERLFALLNDYFSVLIDIIEQHGGVIHQFQGDAVLATYNLPLHDPQHAANAVRTALAIQTVLAERRFGEGILLPTRIGLNTGTVVGGTVGAGGRLGFTVHGDAVNLAARIEQLNKQYGTRILAAQATVEQAGAEFAFELVGELPVRGRQQPVVLYRLDVPTVAASVRPAERRHA